MNRNFVFNDAEIAKPVVFETIFAEKNGGGLLPNQSRAIPAGTAIAINGEGKFEPLKAFVLYADAASDATSIKLKKGSGVTASTVIGVGNIAVAATALDSSNDDYDVVTISLGVAVKKGQVLFEAASAANGALAGYYDSTSGADGALKVVASGATTGQINIDDVAPYFGRQELAANDYVVLCAPAEPKYAPVYLLGTDVAAGIGDTEVRLINGANVRKETVPCAPEVLAMMSGIHAI